MSKSNNEANLKERADHHYIKPDSEYVQHQLIFANTIQDRLYQKKIFESTRLKNSLVILPTALGKTIISILACADMLLNYRKSRILMMAPTRPLVAQHLTLFCSVLKVPQDQIAFVTGKVSPHLRRSIWNDSKIRLIFATPEVVRNDIDSSRIDLQDYAMLIFDEAHRAVKDYAYTSIAKAYVKCSSNPVILAMTASPGADRQRVQEVCNNLFIEKIEYRNDGDADVTPYLNQIDVKWEWVELPKEYRYLVSLLKPMLNERLWWLVNKGIIGKKNIDWIFKKDLLEAGESLRLQIDKASERQEETGGGVGEGGEEEEQRTLLLGALVKQSMALTLMYCIELIESQGPFSLKSFFDRIVDDNKQSHKILLNDSRIKEIRTIIDNINKDHPKIIRALDIIKAHLNNGKYSFDGTGTSSIVAEEDEEEAQDEEASASSPLLCESGDNSNSKKILVFTQFRDTAKHLVDVLRVNNIRSERFVGQAKRVDDLGMKQQDQFRVLESFRNGKFDVLVSTSIAEEGLDIPDVDLVVFYEPVSSEIRYIQRRGRTGRKSAGSVIILATNDTIDMRLMHAGKRKVAKMHESLESTSTLLKPLTKRTPLLPDPMSLEDLGLIEAQRRMYDKVSGGHILSQIRGFFNGDTYTLNQSSSIESEIESSTKIFKTAIERVSRKIYSELVMAGRLGVNVEMLSEKLKIKDSDILTEALQNLEKLKQLVWLDKHTVAIARNNKKRITGEVHTVFIEKVSQGSALVTVDDKWHARLNHYDYEGPKEFLKKGMEFQAISELYRQDGVFSIRIKDVL